jgi:hypothetical protein
MNCDPNALLESAKCFCFGEKQAQAVKAYLLCQIANATPVTGNFRITNLNEFRSTNTGDLRIWA